MIDYRTAVRAALWVAAVGLPVGVAAQPLSGDGFMFGRPEGTFTLRAGYAQPTAGSEVFSFVHQHLTLGRNDFAGGSLSADLGFFVAERLAVQLSAGLSARTVGSEYRGWVHNNDLPIQQSTSLRRMPLMLGLKYYLSPPGRSLGQLAWVPARLTPYVTAGVGTMWYSFRQTGDFMDFADTTAFPDTYESSSWAGAGYGAVGVDYAMSPRVGLVGEARYDRAHATMGADFAGFDRIDLSGLSATLGLTFRF